MSWDQSPENWTSSALQLFVSPSRSLMRRVIRHDINDKGQVVGWSVVPGGDPSPLRDRQAFVTGANGVGMTDLGALGGTFSRAYDINDAGQVSGQTGNQPFSWSGNHAFITGPGGAGMTDLNSLVALPDGVVLVEATGINDRGQVVAMGIVQIIPEPSVYAMLLAGLGFIGVVSRRRLHGLREGIWVSSRKTNFTRFQMAPFKGSTALQQTPLSNPLWSAQLSKNAGVAH
jgi:probable HAF family extracellular repeat protein